MNAQPPPFPPCIQLVGAPLKFGCVDRRFYLVLSCFLWSYHRLNDVMLHWEVRLTRSRSLPVLVVITFSAEFIFLAPFLVGCGLHSSSELLSPARDGD